MSIQEQKITEAAIAANGVQSRPDKLTGTAAQNKKVFDALVTAVVREKFNALLDELTGTSAAAQLGITTIPGFSAGNVQTALEQIVQAMQDVTQGAVTAQKIAPGAVTAEKIAAGAIITALLAPNAVTAEKLANDIPYTKFGLAADQVRLVYAGTTEPGAELGSDGDIYLMYSE